MTASVFDRIEIGDCPIGVFYPARFSVYGRLRTGDNRRITNHSNELMARLSRFRILRRISTIERHYKPFPLRFHP